MSGSAKSLLFIAVLCGVCSLLLTAASSGLKPYQERNILIDRHRNVLLAAGLIEPGSRLKEAEVEVLYAERIRELRVDPEGRILEGADAARPDGLPFYLIQEGGEIRGYIVPIDSRGLWGPIQAYLAIDRDGQTVKGFAVTRHAETPGLGGEIEKEWFRRNWVGKKIATREGTFVSVGIAKGKVEEQVPEPKRPHYVDGISGATMTGKFLSAGIRDSLSRYEPVSIRFRRNQIAEWEQRLPPARP
ncbi:MAG: FMN-binding protein [Desulfobacterales bacterium]